MVRKTIQLYAGADRSPLLLVLVSRHRVCVTPPFAENVSPTMKPGSAPNEVIIFIFISPQAHTREWRLVQANCCPCTSLLLLLFA